MEVLTRALAERVPDLRLDHAVESIDLEARTIVVVARNTSQPRAIRFDGSCICTLPLPRVLMMCPQAPPRLLRAALALKRNRVMSVALSIKGPRPSGCGHWRYYADESLIFTRLIFMHAFDPLMAPPDGWGLLAEITEPAETPQRSPCEYFARVRADAARAGVITDDCRVIDEHLILVDPAYVVFTKDSQDLVRNANDFLLEHGVVPVGRYGRWEYSSMGQVMRDGFAAADALVPPAPRVPLHALRGADQPGATTTAR
jgi:hypothetical protein